MVPLSYIVRNTVQSVINHNFNLLGDYASMDLLIGKVFTIYGSNVHTLRSTLLKITRNTVEGGCTPT